MTLRGYFGARPSSDVAHRLHTLGGELRTGPGWSISCGDTPQHIHTVRQDGEHVGFAVGRVITRSPYTDPEKLSLQDFLRPPGEAAWGDFSVCAFDRSADAVLLVTDPLGLGQFLYARTADGTWIFATQPRELMVLLGATTA